MPSKGAGLRPPKKGKATGGKGGNKKVKHARSRPAEKERDGGSGKRGKSASSDVLLDESESEDEKTTARNAKRFDRDGSASYEYELPKNFEDEEIDEDEAFNSDDEAKYAGLLVSAR